MSFARGDRIAQLVIAPVARAELALVEELGQRARRLAASARPATDPEVTP